MSDLTLEEARDALHRDIDTIERFLRWVGSRITPANIDEREAAIVAAARLRTLSNTILARVAPAPDALREALDALDSWVQAGRGAVEFGQNEDGDTLVVVQGFGFPERGYGVGDDPEDAILDALRRWSELRAALAGPQEGGGR